jgi:hypothetical protein
VVSLDLAETLAAVARLGDDFDAADRFQQRTDPGPKEFVVIHE